MRLWPKRKEQRETLSSPSQSFVRDLNNFFGLSTVTGDSVNPSSAITGTIAVFACVGIIADSVATLPMLVYKGEGESREKLPDTNPFAHLIHRQPNPEQTAQEFYEAVTASVCLWGNSYSYIERDAAGAVSAIWPLRPDAMTCYLSDGSNVYDPNHYDPLNTPKLQRVYRYTLPTGEVRILFRDQILHVRGLAQNGFVGISPITAARQAIALEQAATAHAGSLWKNAGVPGGILNVPIEKGRPNLSEDDKKKIRSDWNKLHQGVSRGHTMAILEGGVTWQSIGMPLDDAQFLETRKFQVIEIARLFRVPPHLIGDVERSTSWGTGIEQQNLGFYTLTLRPWLERIEQAVNRDLGAGRGGRTLGQMGLTAEFLVEGLLRGDTLTRYQSYELAIRNRIMVPNEARRKENLPPLDGGDDPFVPVNYQSVPETEAPPQPDVTPTEP